MKANGVALVCILAIVSALPHRNHHESDSRASDKRARWVTLEEGGHHHNLADIELDDDCLRPLETPLPTHRPLTVGYTIYPLMLEKSSPQIGWLDVLASLVNPRPEHVCAAHRAGVRILANPQYADKTHEPLDLMRNWSNSTLMAQHQTILEKFIVEVGVDGFAHDYEGAMERGAPEYRGYVEVVKTSSRATEKHAPQGLVVVAVAWSPDAIDGRLYDYLSLSHTAFLFVMAYDMASQIWTRCIASPNAPFYQVRKGLNRFLDLGIAPHKLILGTGWYGHEYTCNNAPKTGLDLDFCVYSEYPWRDAACTDVGSGEYGFGWTNSIVNGQAGLLTSAPKWDSTAGQNYINFVATRNASSTELVLKQLWYADVRSLEMQYSMAISELGIGGLGMWTPDSLHWKTAADVASSREMIALLSQFAGPGSPHATETKTT